MSFQIYQGKQIIFVPGEILCHKFTTRSITLREGSITGMSISLIIILYGIAWFRGMNLNVCPFKSNRRIQTRSIFDIVGPQKCHLQAQSLWKRRKPSLNPCIKYEMKSMEIYDHAKLNYNINTLIL